MGRFEQLKLNSLPIYICCACTVSNQEKKKKRRVENKQSQDNPSRKYHMKKKINKLVLVTAEVSVILYSCL